MRSVGSIWATESANHDAVLVGEILTPAATPRAENLAPLVRFVRSERVILEADLAALYGVPTRAMNQKVRRNEARFTADFMSQLAAEKWADSRSQTVIASRRNVRALPTVGHPFLPRPFKLGPFSRKTALRTLQAD